MVLAWWTPGTIHSVLLGWISVTFLTLLPSQSDGKLYRYAYLSGVLSYLFGFYWLGETVRSFGGYPTWAAYLVLLVFALFSATQHLIFAYFCKKLPDIFGKLGILTATAWVISELQPIRIFPWLAAHTQIAFRPFAQIADISSALLISFMMFWIAEAAVRVIFEKRSATVAIAPLTLFLASLIYGYGKITEFHDYSGPRQKVALIQANVSTEEKRNTRNVVTNLSRYFDLTKQTVSKDLLVIWPESVIQKPIRIEAKNIQEVRSLPYFPSIENLHFLTGAITYNTQKEIFNSAIGVRRDGTLLEPYHKQILMPFGEYMPFAETFPWIQKFNPMAQGFSAGEDVRVFEYPRGKDKHSIFLSPLICYEDIVPSISRRAVKKGAELLVNITNDAWFGDTIASSQHHLIASFRAIENRRYLLRSTNSGLTAIVDPIGRTVSQLETFSDGVIKENIRLIDKKSIYSKYLGVWPWWLLAAISACATIWGHAIVPLHGPKK